MCIYVCKHSYVYVCTSYTDPQASSPSAASQAPPCAADEVSRSVVCFLNFVIQDLLYNENPMFDEQRFVCLFVVWVSKSRTQIADLETASAAAPARERRNSPLLSNTILLYRNYVGCAYYSIIDNIID